MRETSLACGVLSIISAFLIVTETIKPCDMGLVTFPCGERPLWTWLESCWMSGALYQPPYEIVPGTDPSFRMKLTPKVVSVIPILCEKRRAGMTAGPTHKKSKHTD